MQPFEEFISCLLRVFVETIIHVFRSKGDGLVFKRMFIEIKKKLKDLISKSGDTWLMDKGLTYSQTPPVGL